MPMLPLAPDLFSTTTCCPSESRHEIADDAGGDVGGPAGRKRNDEMNWAAPANLPPRPPAPRAREPGRKQRNAISASPLPLFFRIRRRIWYRLFSRRTLHPTIPKRHSGSSNRHAILQVSSRAHGLHQARDAGTVRRRLLRRARAGLYRRHLRHRRHRHGESVVADHIGLEQAAVQQARRSELRDG